MNSNNAKVFVTNAYPAMMRKLQHAGKYGELVIVTDLEFRGGPGSTEYNKSAMNNTRAAMKDYVSGFDYILTAGNMVNAMAVARTLMPGTHKILKWNNKWEDYEEVPFTVE